MNESLERRRFEDTKIQRGRDLNIERVEDYEEYEIERKKELRDSTPSTPVSSLQSSVSNQSIRQRQPGASRANQTKIGV